MIEPALPPGFVLAILGVVGLVVGSFLNVVIYRVPLGKSIVWPGSACPACGHAIRAHHNVPVLSWLLLRGRCADCGVRIPVRYPLVEAGHAALWLAAAARFGIGRELLIVLPLLSGLLVLFFTDWDHHLLPDRVTLPLAALGLALAPWNARLDDMPGWLGSGTAASRLAAAALGAALGYGIFLALSLTWELLFKRDAIGGGDFKLMLGVGAFLGMGGSLLTIFLGSFVGALFSVPFLLVGSWSMKRELPFGCFLVPAAVFAAFWGNEALRWYLGLLS